MSTVDQSQLQPQAQSGVTPVGPIGGIDVVGPLPDGLIVRGSTRAAGETFIVTQDGVPRIVMDDVGDITLDAAENFIVQIGENNRINANSKNITFTVNEDPPNNGPLNIVFINHDQAKAGIDGDGAGLAFMQRNAAGAPSIYAWWLPVWKDIAAGTSQIDGWILRKGIDQLGITIDYDDDVSLPAIRWRFPDPVAGGRNQILQSTGELNLSVMNVAGNVTVEIGTDTVMDVSHTYATISNLSSDNGPYFVDWGDSVSAPGDATLNTSIGVSAIVATTKKITITNNKIVGRTVHNLAVEVSLQSDDATLKSVVASNFDYVAGKFDIVGNVNATATAVVLWELKRKQV